MASNIKVFNKDVTVKDCLVLKMDLTLKMIVDIFIVKDLPTNVSVSANEVVIVIPL